MVIIISNKKIESIRITIETPFELNALYILLQLISKEELKKVRNATNSFDDMPGLGQYCKQDLRENPVKRIYELMIGKGKIKPTATQLRAVVMECKRAICEFNDRLTQLFDSNLMLSESEVKLPHAMLLKAAGMRRPLTEDEFKHDSYFKWRDLVTNKKNDLYEEYRKYQDIIASFAPIDTSHAPNITGLIEAFKLIANMIDHDEYMKNDEVHVEGISLNWNEKKIKPQTAGTLSGIGVAVSITMLKSLYDSLWRSAVEGGSPVLKYIVDNGVNIFSIVAVLYTNRWVTSSKEAKDNALMEDAVKTLAENIPLYRQLLIEKGFAYKGNEISYVITNVAEQGVVLNMEPNNDDDINHDNNADDAPLLLRRM